MILDRGICEVYRKTDTSGAGYMPAFSDVLIHKGWYGELDFETAPARPTESREEIRTDARVRILQNRGINNHDRVALTPTGGTTSRFEVTRAYHGTDDESGELITDLTLEVVDP